LVVIVGAFSLGSVPAAPETTGAGQPSWARRVDLLWPALLTLAIALTQIGRAPLWRDELASWSAASRPTGALLRLAANVDAVFLPYYLFLHGWIATFGDSPTALRLPSAISMAGATALVTVLGRRLFGARTGLVAGLLFAVLPSTCRYGQEARPYALVTLFAVLSTLLLVLALARPSGWARWLGYAAALAGLGLSHLLAVTLVAAHAVGVFLAWRRSRDRRLARWLLALVPAVLLLAPLAVLGRGQQERQLGWVRTPGPGSVINLPTSLPQSAMVGGLLVGLAAVGLASSGRWGTLLCLCVLLPAAVLFVGGQVTHLWVPRYLIFTVPFAVLLAAVPPAPLGLRWALPIVAIAGLLGAHAQAEMRRTHETNKLAPIDYRTATQIIGSGQQPGDGIVYSPRNGSGYLDIAVAYYLRQHRPRDVLQVQDPVAATNVWGTECAQPARCLTKAPRIWLLIKGEQDDPLRSLPEAKAHPLREGYRLDRVWKVPGLTLALLTSTAG
jgi:mannosyltransferase